MTLYEQCNLVITTLGVVGGLAAVGITYFQLRKVNETLSLSVLNTVLSIESELNARNTLRQDAAQEAIRLAATSIATTEELKAAQLKIDATTEQYLNALDRLCACFLRNALPEATYRRDYRDMVREARESNPKYFTDARPRFRNIITLDDRWRDA